MRASFDGDNVESPRSACGAAFSEKPTSHALHMPAFIRGNGFLGQAWARFRAGTSFHFDECEHRAIIADQVYFSLSFRSAIIARHHDVPVAAQVPIGVRLAANARAAGLLFRGLAGLRFRKSTARGELN